ncbi:Cytochrome P450 CYP749A22 [Linum perenne]
MSNGNCGYGSDFLGLLVKSYHDESKEVSINNVVDECKTFYVAGQHPTNFLLSWVLSMIINETLRLYPSSIELTRKVENVHQFKPERFREGISEATNNNPVAFIPFGLGPRSCVGSNFVTLEAKVVLSMILQRFSFTLSPAYTHSIYPAITIRPMHGVQVILQAA